MLSLRPRPRPRVIARASLVALVLLGAGASSPPASPTRLLSRPAISQRQVAFIYAGDLWVAGLDGSNARRLTSDGGISSSPAFSPDGRTIAFVLLGAGASSPPASPTRLLSRPAISQRQVAFIYAGDPQ